jgi:hypothetical protein
VMQLQFLKGGKSGGFFSARERSLDWCDTEGRVVGVDASWARSDRAAEQVHCPTTALYTAQRAASMPCPTTTLYSGKTS